MILLGPEFSWGTRIVTKRIRIVTRALNVVKRKKGRSYRIKGTLPKRCDMTSNPYSAPETNKFLELRLVLVGTES